VYLCQKEKGSLLTDKEDTWQKGRDKGEPGIFSNGQQREYFLAGLPGNGENIRGNVRQLVYLSNAGKGLLFHKGQDLPGGHHRVAPLWAPWISVFSRA